MAVNTSGWSLIPGGPGNQGILQWAGGGGAPMTDASTQSALRGALSNGGATPAGTQGSFSQTPEFDFSSLQGEGGGESPGLVPYTPGPITSVVNDLLTAAIGGNSGGRGPAQTLHRLSKGGIPDATMAAYQQNQALQNAAITESMGAVGNRFGTDLARTLADAAGRLNVNLSAAGMDRALAAIAQIIGLGQGQSNLEFAGQEGALNRANQDFLATQGGDSFTQLLPLLLGLGAA